MRWPDIFFKAKKPRPEHESPPPFTPAPESSKTANDAPKPPTIKPLPAALGPQAQVSVTPVPQKAGPPQTGTRTLPAMHGVVLRPPTRPTPTTGTLPPAAPAAPAATGRATTPLKNIEELMAEADPVRTLSQTGSLLLKKISPATAPLAPAVNKAAEPVPVKSDASTPTVTSPVAPKPVAVLPPNAPWTPPPFPAFKPAGSSPADDIKKADSTPANAMLSVPEPAAPSHPITQTPVLPVISSPVPAPVESTTPFILKPAASPESTPRIIPPPPPPAIKPVPLPLGSIFRRRAKMTDLAKIVLPPKREDTQPLHPPAGSTPTVVPPAFPVAAMTARASHLTTGTQETTKLIPPKPSESPAPKTLATEEKTPEAIPVASSSTPTEKPWAEKTPDTLSESKTPTGAEAPVPEIAPASIPVTEQKPATPAPDLHIEPKVDAEAHKPEPSHAQPPKVDPEAPKPAPPPAPPVPTTELSVPPAPLEKREFHLANGERVVGMVLSETPEAIYVDHSTLGVLTIPRAQIAKRLVEIILINGDRIVGDIMAETADTLYVRHASLGMLTVPRAQRSTRVVEAILKDGDRILGEVLTETETFTVIRSATLGTITVPHDKMAMLNRKIEQIELKALPPPAPEIKDKPA